MTCRRSLERVTLGEWMDWDRSAASGRAVDALRWSDTPHEHYKKVRVFRRLWIPDHVREVGGE
jgi:hypothetical protein